MGTFWTAIVAAFIAEYPGATLYTIAEGSPWPNTCVVIVDGGGMYASGYATMPDPWDPEPITDTCDRAAEDMMSVVCTAPWTDPESEYCQF